MEKPTNHYKGMQLNGMPFDIYDLENQVYPHHPAEIRHAIKKLIRLGKGAKTKRQDALDAIYSIYKYLANEVIFSNNHNPEEFNLIRGPVEKMLPEIEAERLHIASRLKELK
jgi:hypothetical protein